MTLEDTMTYLLGLLREVSKKMYVKARSPKLGTVPNEYNKWLVLPYDDDVLG